MGKTRATYREKLDEFANDWTSFRRALVREYNEHWDQLVTDARNHAHAAGNQNPLEPRWGIVFSMMLEQQRRIAELEEQLAAVTEAEEGGANGRE